MPDREHPNLLPKFLINQLKSDKIASEDIFLVNDGTTATVPPMAMRDADVRMVGARAEGDGLHPLTSHKFSPLPQLRLNFGFRAGSLARPLTGFSYGTLIRVAQGSGRSAPVRLGVLRAPVPAPARRSSRASSDSKRSGWLGVALRFGEQRLEHENDSLRPRRAATVTQVDIARAIRDVRAAGLPVMRVIVRSDSVAVETVQPSEQAAGAS